MEFLIPGDLRAASGGYLYDRRLLAELRALGCKVSVRALDASFPLPTAAALEHAERVLAAIPARRPVLIDGLAFGAMPQVLRKHAARLSLLVLMHMPLSAGLQWNPRLRARLGRLEASALAYARRVIVTGRGSLPALREYGVPAERIVLIEPGTDVAPLADRRRSAQRVTRRAARPGVRPGARPGARPARRRSAPRPPRLLCVATVQPGKGHEQLIEALAPLTSLPWRLTCVGSLTRSPEYVARLRARVRELGLAGRVELVGEVRRAALERHYRRCDLFVLATRFESYGMAVAEALAHGLPVVSTRTGAIPDLVGRRAGRLVAPGNVAALGAALAAALRDAALLRRWAQGAAAARRRLPRWSDAAARVVALGRLPAPR